MNSVIKNIYLYDFAFCDVFATTNLLIFGYMYEQQQWRKVELLVQNFDITLALSVDCNIFKQSPNKSEVTTMVENYLYSANNKQKLKDLVLDYKELVGFLPFKGAQSIENNQKIAQFEFRSFKDYEAFQRKINNINENIIDKFKNTKEAIDDYIIKTLSKEFLYLHQFILNEQSQYTKGQVQYEILNDILELFDSQPNKCSTLLEIAHIQIRSKGKYIKVLNDVDTLLDQLKRKCTYTPNLTKYPFRILENDSKNNYILKLLRHSNCQLSGFNKVTLTANPEIPEDPTQRIHLTCNSLQDIIFDSTFEPNTNPLTLLAWDIEVCTQTGKFDNDGTNDQNKVLCIGMSYGLIQQGIENKQRIGVCITWVDSADNQLTLLQFADLYREYLRNPKSINLQSQYVVRSANESQMIKDFFSLINLFDPSFITGFNDFQFDFPFIKDKISTFGAKDVSNNIQELLQRGFTFKSKNDLFHSQSIKINASDNKAGISLDVRGIISIDTRILLMKTQKLEKKSLNDYLLANNLPVKLDVSFRDMNKAFKTINSENQVNNELLLQQRNDSQMDTQGPRMDTQGPRMDTQGPRMDTQGPRMDTLIAKQILSDVFKYCMYDSEACCLLWQKRSILQQSVEVSKLSFTPLKYAFLNADGIKVRNMVAKFAFDRKFCVPMTNSSHDIRLRDIECLNKYEKYPGAYVSPPKKGISTTPVSALDFESLYPSIIMAHNLSPEKVIEPFEIIPYSTKTTQIGIPFEKGDMKEILEGNVLTRESGVGIYPEILKYLFDSRKQVKKSMEHIAEQADQTNDPIVKKELEFQTTLLNCKQLAIKVFMNTFYGETGNQKSPLFDVLISGGTTTLGQKYIRQVHSFIEEQDCEIVYGDSILGDEPLLLRDEHNLINIKTIESLMFNSAIRDYGMSKEQSPSNYQIWVYDKWVPIKRVIRHKVAKDIYRVNTGNSMIEVTEDHSLINTQFKQIKPVDCDVLDTKILQGFPKIQEASKLNNCLTKLQITKLYIMGLLFDYKQEIPLRILNAPKFMKKLFIKGVFYDKLQVTDNEPETMQNTPAHGHQMKQIDNQGTISTTQVWPSDVLKGNNKLITGSVVCKTKLMAQQVYFLIYQIGYHPSIESLDNNKYLVHISNIPVKYSNTVIGIKKMKQYKVQYVYDIETDLGMFGAGIGQMTLKNTDSVYFRPRFSHFALYKQQKELELRQNNISLEPNSITYKEINDISADMLQSAYDATERLKVEINTRIGEQTSGFLKLAFEELLYPSMFTGKKKYCGVVYVPGKMTVKSKLTIKDILLRGIDFIKSQYPQIIKQVGQQTLINIMEHFMLNIKGFNADQLQEIFKDTYRDNLNTQLKDLIQSQILNLNTRLLSIQPQEYQLLASKKKLRSTKTGQMMLFRQRLVDIDNPNRAFIFNSLKEIVLQIDISELQQSGIDVPEDGEILDLISVNPPSTMPKLKASELIHLLQYAQQRRLPINIQEYLKMYRTTASRILVSAFFDNSINDPDEQEKQALKQAKKFCDECQMSQISEKESLLATSLSKDRPKTNVFSRFPATEGERNVFPCSPIKYPEQYLRLISTLEETRIKLDNLVQNCINKAYQESCNITPIQVRHLVIDQQKLLSYIYQYLTVNPRRSSTLHVLCNLNQIKLKLEFCLEQSNISGSNLQLQQYIDYIEKLTLEYQESHLLLVIFRIVVLLQHQTAVKLSIEQIKSFISRLIYIQQWKEQYSKLMGFIARYNKIPPEMSESYNWLFKQKTVYIELSKAINKKSLDNKNIETASKDIQLPIPEFFDISSVINSLLIQKSDIIKKFFEESIWDLEYQQFKKNPIQQTKWANEQVDLYKKGILKQMHILKIMKVWPEIHV